MSDAKTTPPGPSEIGGEKTKKTPQTSTQQNGQEQEKMAGAEAVQNLDELRKKAAERDQYLDLAQRTRAEFENYQKRNQREREQERQYFTGGFILDFLPVLDNLERATAAAKQADEKGPLVQGVAMVEQQFLNLLKRHGVTRIEAEGTSFDASRHQAIHQQPMADKPANTVLQVVEPGYMHNDRVLRPAKVVVSQALPPGEKK